MLVLSSKQHAVACCKSAAGNEARKLVAPFEAIVCVLDITSCVVDFRYESHQVNRID